MVRDDGIVRETEKNILHLDKWNRRLMRALWALFGVLAAIEVGIAFVYSAGVTLGVNLSVRDYIIGYVLIPCLLVFITVLAAQLIWKFVIPRFSPTMQSRFILGVMIVVVSETVAVHYGISVVFTLYTMPVAVSILYVDRTTTRMVFAFCILAYLLTFFGYVQNFVPGAYYRHDYIDTVGTITILAIVYAFSNIVIARVRELTNTAVDQSILKMQLSHEVTLDSLTELYNHATFYSKLDEAILRYQEEKAAFSILIMDIDDFKRINDSYGHDAGDTVILALADIIRKNIGAEDMAFRYGGEEFAVITSDGSPAEMAERIRSAFEKRRYADVKRKVTVSIGVCRYDETFGGRREFFSAADKALYRAKHEGKNGVRFAEQQTREQERRTV